jgi:hypothetical protein
MGRSRKIHYVIHIITSDSSGWVTPSEWKCKESGKPTTENIDRYVTVFENSLKPGGCNAHLGFFTLTKCWIVDQFKGEIVAEWVRKEYRPDEPLFQVI